MGRIPQVQSCKNDNDYKSKIPGYFEVPFIFLLFGIILIEAENQRHEQPKNIFNLKTTDISVIEEMDEIGSDSYSHSYKQIGLTPVTGFVQEIFYQAVANHSKEPQDDNKTDYS